MYRIKATDSEFAAIITAASYQSPLEQLPSIIDELKLKRISGEILFDMLCSNGNEWNRFASMSFNGITFERKTFQIIDPNNLPVSLPLEDETSYQGDDFFHSSVMS